MSAPPRRTASRSPVGVHQYDGLDPLPQRLEVEVAHDADDDFVVIDDLAERLVAQAERGHGGLVENHRAAVRGEVGGEVAPGHQAHPERGDVLLVARNVWMVIDSSITGVWKVYIITPPPSGFGGRGWSSTWGRA